MSTSQSTEIVRMSEVTRTTAITIQTSEQSIALSVADVLKWVAPNAPDDEAMKFLFVCQARGLNPLLGEADLVPFGPKWQTVVSKSGYLKLMEEHPAYAGHEAGIIVRQWDAVARKDVGEERYLDGSYRPSECRLVGGWARIYRSDRAKPTFLTVSAEEYNKGTGTYLTIPCTMMRKVALVQCAAESGLINAPRGYSPEEAPQPIWTEPTEQLSHSSDRLELEYANARDDASLPPYMVSKIIMLRDEVGIPEDSFEWRDTLARRGVGHVAELTMVQAQGLMSNLWGLIPHPDLASDATSQGEVVDVEFSETAGVIIAPKTDVENDVQTDIENGEAFELPEMTRAPRKGEATTETKEIQSIFEPVRLQS